MTATLDTKPATDLISQMRTATLPAHEKLDDLIMASEPFADRENYSRLLTMQYCLQRDLEPLYHDATLRGRLPDLESRSRLSLVEQDMADLQLALPTNDAETPVLPLSDLAASVGWLFVLEGSRLGAASLFRRATALGLSETFGARHLAGPAGGPAEKWRVFTQTISALPFTDEERNRATSGAVDAFEYAAGLAQKIVHAGKKEPDRA